MQQLAISLNQIFGWNIALSTIVAITIGALWTIYFNRIKESQRAEFQKQIEFQKSEFSKQLENLKTKNDKINYITKTQFDAEFKMYQELSKKTFDAYINIGMLNIDLESLSSIGLNTIEEDFLEKKGSVSEANYSFAECFRSYYPFIDKNICIEYKKFLDQLLEIDKKVSSIEYIKKNDKMIEKDIINVKQQIDVINENLREYLQTLKIMDGNNE